MICRSCRTMFAVEVVLSGEGLGAVLEKGMNGFVKMMRGSLCGQGHEHELSL
jgi:hypothetical protein